MIEKNGIIIKKLALLMHDNLRKLGVTEKEKPLFIASILIALNNEDFQHEYRNFNSSTSLIKRINIALDEQLNKESGINPDKKNYIKQALNQISKNEKIKKIKLTDENSVMWYIEELEKKILP